MRDQRCFIQLGRIGDVLNVLPIAKDYFDETGKRPLFMVNAEFAQILEGVSYVQPFIFFGPWTSILLAISEAAKETSDIVVCQIHGDGMCNPRLATSFARESWLSANCKKPWGSLPLVFDRRDEERERELVATFIGDDKRPVVLFAGEGKSSPFAYSRLVRDTLRRDLGITHKIIDLSMVHASRFYDLLALFERAHCLVAIDTAHQHLAAACPGLDVVALRTRDPEEWHGSPWRPQHVLNVAYDEVPMYLGKIVAAARLKLEGWPRRIIHAWADWRDGAPGVENLRRCAVAQDSWRQEYKLSGGRWFSCEIGRDDARRSGHGIGDPHPVPYLHDIVERAIPAASSLNDIIALTNADVGFVPGATGKIIETVARYGSAYTHRRDFHQPILSPFTSEAEMKKGVFYPGTDAFFFTVRWWEAHKNEYADFIMGREHWDEVLRQLIKFYDGREITNIIWHEWHESFWCGTQRQTLAGNIHNARLRDEWFKATGLQPEDFRWWRTSTEMATHPHPKR